RGVELGREATGTGEPDALCEPAAVEVEVHRPSRSHTNWYFASQLCWRANARMGSRRAPFSASARARAASSASGSRPARTGAPWVSYSGSQLLTTGSPAAAYSYTFIGLQPARRVAAPASG